MAIEEALGEGIMVAEGSLSDLGVSLGSGNAEGDEMEAITRTRADFYQPQGDLDERHDNFRAYTHTCRNGW